MRRMLSVITEPLRIRNVVLGEGIPKICVSLMAAGREELRKQAEEAVKRQTDLAEWRADFYEAVEEPGSVREGLLLLRETLGEMPVIFTVRTKSEGGNREFSLKTYRKILESAAGCGQADLIDVEFFKNQKEMEELIRGIHEKGGRVIASHHNFSITESRQMMVRRMRKMDQAGADMLKIAMMPKNLDDVCDVLKTAREMVQEYTRHPVVAISMAEMGRVSRYCGEVFGSCMTFAALDEGAAPGQEAVETVRKALRFYHENYI